MRSTSRGWCCPPASRWRISRAPSKPRVAAARRASSPDARSGRTRSGRPTSARRCASARCRASSASARSSIATRASACGDALDDRKERNRTLVAQFRARDPGIHYERLVILTTTGRKSGRPHTTPLLVHRDAERLIVIASNAGAPTHPDWFRNLVADPNVSVEIDDQRFDAIATPLTGDERERVWTMLKQ